MTTKLIITVTVCCIFGIAVVKGFNKEELLALIEEAVTECKAEVGATNYKCVRSCIMKKSQMMDDNGKFVKTVALTHANAILEGDDEKKKIVIDLIDKCSEITVADDHCEAAEQYGKCIREEAKANNLYESFGI